MYLLASAVAILSLSAPASSAPLPAYDVPAPEDFAPMCEAPSWFNNNSDYPHTPATCVTAVVMEMDLIAVECAWSADDPGHCLDLYAHAAALGEACIEKAIKAGG